jgi:ABC-2 type transport system ATP-binding protein
MTIEVTDLVKRQGQRFTLNVPWLYIGAGETFGLVGNNGAGKTTLLRLLLDLSKPDRGQVLYDRQDIASNTDWKLYTGSYLDPSFLLDFLTPDEFFEFVGSTYGLDSAEIQRRLELYKPFFNDPVLGQRNKYIRDLSLGNTKKVGIVAAMLVRPKILILDEPFANLDPGSQIRLRHLLRDLNLQYGSTLIVSSHDLAHVTEICERIVLVEHGAIARDIQTSDATLDELERYFEAGV